MSVFSRFDIDRYTSMPFIFNILDKKKAPLHVLSFFIRATVKKIKKTILF